MAKQPDIKKVITTLKKKPKKTREAVEKSLAVGGKRVLSEMALNTPYDTGILRMGNKSEVRETTSGVSLSFRNKEPYAMFVEFGTGPIGEASPKGHVPEGIELVYRDIGWVYEKDGRFIYTEGQPARPFFYSSILNNKKVIEQYVKDAIKESMIND